MDTRKVTFIATIAAIVLVAVGIGYAYTASTVNSGNSASPEYITLVQGSTGAYQFADGEQNVYWDATDYIVGSQPTTDFTLTGVVDESITGYKLVQLGKSFTLVADSVGATTAPTIAIDINAENFIMPVEGSVIMEPQLRSSCP